MKNESQGTDYIGPSPQVTYMEQMSTTEALRITEMTKKGHFAVLTRLCYKKL